MGFERSTGILKNDRLSEGGIMAPTVLTTLAGAVRLIPLKGLSTSATI